MRLLLMGVGGGQAAAASTHRGGATVTGRSSARCSPLAVRRPVAHHRSRGGQEAGGPFKRALPGQQRGAVFEAHHGARRFGAACWLRPVVARSMLNGFVVVDPGGSVVPLSLKVSMVAEGFHGNRGLVP